MSWATWDLIARAGAAVLAGAGAWHVFAPVVRSRRDRGVQ